jgi:hypothetical protein
MCIQSVSFFSSVWAIQNHWQEWLNMHPECEFSLQCSSISELLMRMAECTFRMWVPSPLFEQIRATDKNGCTRIQHVSSLSRVWPYQNHWQEAEHVSSMWVLSPVFEHIRITDKIGWMCIQQVSLFSHVWADQNHWQERLNTHPASESVLQCLSLSEPLTRMAEHALASSEWVCSPMFEQIRTTDKIGWTHIQQVS